MGGADRRAVVAGHQPQFVKQSGDAAGAGRVCCPVPVVGIVGRLCKSWRLVHRLAVVPSFVCYLVTLDADGGGDMHMGKRKEGRERPEKRAEPREIEPSDAAPDQAEEFPRMVVVDDTALAPSDGIPGEVRSGRADVSEPPENTAGDVVMDTGWYDHRGWNVRVKVIGGPPNRNRRRWFQGRLMSD